MRSATLALFLFVAATLNAQKDKITTFDVPNGTFTTPLGISPSGAIVGYYDDTMGEIRGFLRDSHGKFITFNFPNEPSIFPTAVNQSGEIVGYYDVPFNQQTEPVQVGFVRNSSGTFTSIKPPGSTNVYPNGINSA